MTSVLRKNSRLTNTEMLVSRSPSFLAALSLSWAVCQSHSVCTGRTQLYTSERVRSLLSLLAIEDTMQCPHLDSCGPYRFALRRENRAHLPPHTPSSSSAIIHSMYERERKSKQPQMLWCYQGTISFSFASDHYNFTCVCKRKQGRKENGRASERVKEGKINLLSSAACARREEGIEKSTQIHAMLVKNRWEISPSPSTLLTLRARWWWWFFVCARINTILIFSFRAHSLPSFEVFLCVQKKVEISGRSQSRCCRRRCRTYIYIYV
jgi:hypothetical protein